MLLLAKVSPLIQNKERTPTINARRATRQPDKRLAVNATVFGNGRNVSFPEYSFRISLTPNNFVNHVRNKPCPVQGRQLLQSWIYLYNSAEIYTLDLQFIFLYFWYSLQNIYLKVPNTEISGTKWQTNSKRGGIFRMVSELLTGNMSSCSSLLIDLYHTAAILSPRRTK